MEITSEGDLPIAAAFVVEVVDAAREHAGRTELPVSLLFTSDQEIARLHGEYVGDPEPTDVITFAMDDGAEIAISVETARRQAQSSGTEIAAELALYVVHGVLHACGLDDVEPAARVLMRKAEQEVLATLGLHVHPVDEC